MVSEPSSMNIQGERYEGHPLTETRAGSKMNGKSHVPFVDSADSLASTDKYAVAVSPSCHHFTDNAEEASELQHKHCKDVCLCAFASGNSTLYWQGLDDDRVAIFDIKRISTAYTLTLVSVSLAPPIFPPKYIS